jgi:hypothetical protein
MENFINKDVENVFHTYPAVIKEKLLALRQLIYETAKESAEVLKIEETLKWGEPSYMSKTGSTVRMDWKKSSPDQYAMYFHCQTKLVDTFKELYRDILKFEGNRAIIFNVQDEVPIDAIKNCILLSLTYHKRKHLPMLGV